MCRMANSVKRKKKKYVRTQFLKGLALVYTVYGRIWGHGMTRYDLVSIDSMGSTSPVSECILIN